jgi:CHASE2 domain-containing sensor protein
MMKRYLFIAILLLATAASFFNWTQRLDLKLLDLQFRALRAAVEPTPAPEVVIIGIDEETVEQFPEPFALWHKHLAQFLHAMVLAKPAAVGVDIFLPERSFNAFVPGIDQILLRAVIQARRAFPLVFAVTIDSAGKRGIFPPFAAAAGKDGLGYGLALVDGDGVVRRFQDPFEEGESKTATLAGQMLRGMKAQPKSGYIDFAQGELFAYVPLQRVLAWEAAQDAAALERAFAGKPVVLGIILPFEDRKLVPAPLMAGDADLFNVPGVALHAQVLRNTLGRGLIAEVPAYLKVLLGVAAAALWFVSLRAMYSVVIWIAIAAALLAASALLLRMGWLLPVVTPIIIAAVALGARSGYELVMRGLELEFLKRDSQAAREIQENMVPRGQLLPGRAEFDCAALVHPAKAVGGDFLDAFFIDDTHLFMAVGDVSGKGFPAALFMARTIPLLRYHALRGGSLPELLAEVNRGLCENNNACMFATLFCAVLDTANGDLVYACCGHPPPLIADGNAAFTLLPTQDAPALGMVEDVAFETGHARLDAGGTIIIYTDGVTEGTSARNELFEEERLLAAANRHRDAPALALNEAIAAAVDAFAKGVPQFDDLTLLTLRILK